VTGGRRAAPRLPRDPCQLQRSTGERSFDRRAFLRLAASAIGAGALSYAVGGRRRARADASGHAARLIVFYFPDGVPGTSSSGEPSLWNPTGGETDFQLGEVLAPLSARRDRCTFVTGLHMGPADVGSHPGGAKKLLTAVDGGGGESIDQLLARTVGASAPVRHLYLGAQANVSGASGDKHISYVAPGTTISPEDDPRAAFSRLFQGGTPTGGAAGAGGLADTGDASVLDALVADVQDLQGKLGAAEKSKLDLHLEALRDLERRLAGMTGGMPTMPAADCGSPRFAFGDGSLEDPARFPEILRAQTDLAVLAMACGLSRVAVIQASMHTSELVMSRFAGTPLHEPAFDMRSHQASHYGAAHDRGHREYDAFVKQVTWWVGQFAYLLDALAMRPEGAGTMLDESLALLCTEVSDGNTHNHDDMPFVVGGGGGGAIRTGRLLRRDGRRHGELLCALGQAMGAPVGRFGQDGAGPLEGLLSR